MSETVTSTATVVDEQPVKSFSVTRKTLTRVGLSAAALAAGAAVYFKIKQDDENDSEPSEPAMTVEYLSDLDSTQS